MYGYVLCLCSLYVTRFDEFLVCLHRWFARETYTWQWQVQADSTNKNNTIVCKIDCHGCLHETPSFWKGYACDGLEVITAMCMQD